jgi:hypothetical protein
MINDKRNSAFELIRLVAMFMIVVYHILMYFIVPIANTSLYQAMFFPLHLGVILFVLISGYFGIKPSARGLVKLIGMMFIYSVPFAFILKSIYNYGEISLFFVSKTGFWFLRTYICLFLTAPILNKFLDGITTSNRVLLLLIFGFISIYLGTMLGDETLKDGKNLANFYFIYLLGNTIKEYQNKWSLIPKYMLIFVWLLLNTCLVMIFCFFPNLGGLEMRMFYSYCSPGIMLNSVLIFMIFANSHVHSKMVNWLAASALPIYLIHGNKTIFFMIIKPISLSIYNQAYNSLIVFVELGLFALVIMFVCILFDKCLSPIWRCFYIFGCVLDNHLNQYKSTINK